MVSSIVPSRGSLLPGLLACYGVFDREAGESPEKSHYMKELLLSLIHPMTKIGEQLTQNDPPGNRSRYLFGTGPMGKGSKRLRCLPGNQTR